MSYSLLYLDAVMALEAFGDKIFTMSVNSFINNHIIHLEDYSDFTITNTVLRTKDNTQKIAFSKCQDPSIDNLTTYPYVTIINEPFNSYKQYTCAVDANAINSKYINFLGNKSGCEPLLWFGTVLWTLLKDYAATIKVGIVITDNTFTANLAINNRTLSFKINKTLV